MNIFDPFKKDEGPPNRELLEKTLQYIVDHPEEHNQAHWVCGTAMCFAGHAVVLAGHQLHRLSDGTLTGNTVDGNHVSTIARDELGLTYMQSETLFHSKNSVHDIKEIVNDLLNQGDSPA